MVLKKIRGLASLFLAGVLLLGSVPVSSIPAYAVESGFPGTSDRWKDMEEPTLRDYATPYVSFYNYNMGADNFADSSMSSFWNAHGDSNIQNSDQWMMYDFGERKAEITGSSITFYDDANGVVTPANIRIEYEKEAGNWEHVVPKGTWTFAGNIEKSYAFEPVVTSKLRVTMEHAKSGNTKMPVAVYDWKLLGDIPADFPKPVIVTPEAPSPDLSLPDAAIYAVPSSDYTSDWENLNGINNPDFEPSSSDVGTGNGWGNWYQNAGSEHWIQYDWDEAVTTKTFQVYWYGTEAGTMKIPENIRFTYQDTTGSWQDAVIRSDKRNYSKFNRYNQITLEEITAKSIRMYMTVPDGGESNGVYRWKVYSDISEAFVVAAAGNSLVIPEVIDGRVPSRIRKKLTLPATAMNGKVAVSWKSQNADVILDDGTITPPTEDTKVTLTATCSIKENSAVKNSKDMEILVLSDSTTEYAMTIDPKNRGVDISQELFGVFYEDINSSADGGLSTEMVKNNSFENYQNLDSPTAPEVKGDQNSWKLHWDSSKASGFIVERTNGLNEKNQNYAKITGSQQLSNHGFVEKASMDKSAMAITKGKTYDFSMFMKADSAYPGTIKVKVVDDNGDMLTDEAVLTLKKDGTWQKIKASLTAAKTRLGTLVLTFEGAGSSDAIYIDMVSLIPTDGYGYGNQNYSCGAGLRKDLVEKLQELNPSFIRFPGGCVVEGSYGTDGYYNWEDSVGPLEERRAIGSYWGTPGHPVQYTPGYGYMMSYQFGYHEILTLCEDLGAQPFPILSAGIYCQFRQTADAVTGDALKPFAEHAANLIDYCWGSPDSPDETQAYWAKKRVENGHKEPFDLNYLGIGNENWGQIYYENYEWIKKYIEDYVNAHYPDRTITLISSTGPYYQGSQNTEAWNWINRTMPGETLVDEHYYINYAGDGSNTLLNNDYVYDSYRRQDNGGSNVFIGEYAGHLTSTTENVLDTAISEAAYMTGIERNADIVRHASYAPLFEREGCRDWDYNLIKFDAYSSYGTPSYYVQTMYANNYGKHILNTTLEKYNSETSAYDKKPGHQTELYYVTSEDDTNIYTKLVNHTDYSKEITLHYPDIQDGTKVELICLSGASMDMNAITDQTNVAPVTTETEIRDETLIYEVPAMSLTIVKVTYQASGTEEKPASQESIEKLANTIAAAGTDYQEKDYTADSWRVFSAAFEEAKNVAGNADATQEQVDKAQKDLEDAIGQLKPNKTEPEHPSASQESITKLANDIAAANTAYKEADYTPESWKVFITAVEAAKRVIADKNAAQAQIDQAQKELTGAIAQLKKKQPQTPKPPEVKKSRLTLGVKEKISIYKKGYTYQTSDKKYVTVTKKGVIKGVKKGKATVTVKNASGQTVQLCTVTVKNAPKKISKVSPAKKSLKKGGTCKITVTLPKGTASKITFTSSNKKIATVDAKGVVKAKKKGKATITVKTFNGKTKKVKITVK